MKSSPGFKIAAAAALLSFGISAVCAAPAAPNAHKNDLPQAEALLQEAIKTHPHNAILRMQLGFILRKMGRIDQARQAFETASGIDPNLAEPHYMLGLIYEKEGNTRKALREWKACFKSATAPTMKETASQHVHRIETNRP